MRQRYGVFDDWRRQLGRHLLLLLVVVVVRMMLWDGVSRWREVVKRSFVGGVRVRRHQSRLGIMCRRRDLSAGSRVEIHRHHVLQFSPRSAESIVEQIVISRTVGLHAARRTVFLPHDAVGRPVWRVLALMRVGAVRELGRVRGGGMERGGVVVGVHLLLDRLLVNVAVDASSCRGSGCRIHVLVVVDVATERRRRSQRSQNTSTAAADPAAADPGRRCAVMMRQHRELVLLQRHGFGLAARTVLVVWMLLEVQSPQPLRFVDERALLGFREQFPVGAESLRDLRVVHLGVLLRHLAPLTTWPHHERVHRSLDAILVLAGSARRRTLLRRERTLPAALSYPAAAAGVGLLERMRLELMSSGWRARRQKRRSQRHRPMSSDLRLDRWHRCLPGHVDVWRRQTVDHLLLVMLMTCRLIDRERRWVVTGMFDGDRRRRLLWIGQSRRLIMARPHRRVIYVSPRLFLLRPAAFLSNCI